VADVGQSKILIDEFYIDYIVMMFRASKYKNKTREIGVSVSYTTEA